MSQYICYKILQLKKEKRYQEMKFVKNNKKKILKILKSENKVKITDTSTYTYVKVSETWYEFNVNNYHFQKVTSF